MWEVARPKRSLEHPTMKPVELVEQAIQNSTKPRDVVLDAFGGSGTTIIACQKTGRAARAIELHAEVLRRDRAPVAGIHRPAGAARGVRTCVQ